MELEEALLTGVFLGFGFEAEADTFGFNFLDSEDPDALVLPEFVDGPLENQLLRVFWFFSEGFGGIFVDDSGKDVGRDNERRGERPRVTRCWSMFSHDA